MRFFQSKAKDNVAVTPQTFEQAALEFERFKNKELRSSRKIAWAVAGAAGVIAILSAGATGIAIFNREEPKPMIIKLDKGSGVAEVMRELDDAPAHFDEVTDKHWLSKYVCYREGYDWYEISSDYEVVKLMSSDDVGKEYEREIRAPFAPLNTLKETGKLRCKTLGVSFVGTAAQVRYTTEKVNASGFNVDSSPMQFWTATVTFDYQPTRRMTDKEREENPLGFTVLSYRRDAEVRQ